MTRRFRPEVVDHLDDDPDEKADFSVSVRVWTWCVRVMERIGRKLRLATDTDPPELRRGGRTSPAGGPFPSPEMSRRVALSSTAVLAVTLLVHTSPAEGEGAVRSFGGDEGRVIALATSKEMK